MRHLMHIYINHKTNITRKHVSQTDEMRTLFHVELKSLACLHGFSLLCRGEVVLCWNRRQNFSFVQRNEFEKYMFHFPSRGTKDGFYPRTKSG